MKDYSMSEEERDNFVLNYDIEEDNIIVNYASGRKDIISYTDDNERSILDKMKFQFENVEEARDYAARKLRHHTVDLVFLIPFVEFLYLIISGLTAGDISLADLTTNQIVYLTSITALPGLIAGRGICRIVFYYKKILDIAKNRLFQENEFSMNLHVKVNDDYLGNISGKAKDVLKSVPSDKPLFTYNTIDKMKALDVTKIICNIENEMDKGNNNSNDEVKKRIRKR